MSAMVLSTWVFEVGFVLAQGDADRFRHTSMEFHQKAQQRTGILVPLYVYPANIHQNSQYNLVMNLKRRFETVPFWIILNPATGPGNAVDANYAKAIDRLQGAGCVTLGYVSTEYGKRPVADIHRDIDTWRSLYPKMHGIFFDEMNNENTPRAAAHQVSLNDHARKRGFWPTVANPGTDTPTRYFEVHSADVHVIHEGHDWPSETRLQGDYFGGYSDFPPWTRALLVHSQPTLDENKLRMARKYVRWVYVTDAVFKANDPNFANPWDRVSKYLEAMCMVLAGNVHPFRSALVHVKQWRILVIPGATDSPKGVPP